MTITDIIKFLPMSDDIRAEILSTYDTMEPSRKYVLTQAIWRAYMKLYAERLNENLELQLKEVIDGKERLGKDLYSKVLENTENQMTKDFTKSIDEDKLEAARKAMEIIVREIQAFKKKKKYKS